VVPLAAETVVQHEGGDALLVEPHRGLVAFVVLRQIAVAAAGTDHHGCAGVAVLPLRRIELERGRAGLGIDGEGVGSLSFRPERTAFLGERQS